MLAQKDLPQVIVTSYGDIEQTVPYSYAKRVCEVFAQLGARGVSVIFGAGDSGVGKSGYCHANNGTDAYEFLTSFPASCPYGTSVGATRNTESEEIVAFNDRNGFVSGGGFSKYFPRPAYQDAHGVVDSYLSHLGEDKYKGLFNRSGRAYPDVAAQRYRRVMVWNGEKYLVRGWDPASGFGTPVRFPLSRQIGKVLKIDVLATDHLIIMIVVPTPESNGIRA